MDSGDIYFDSNYYYTAIDIIHHLISGFNKLNKKGCFRWLKQQYEYIESYHTVPLSPMRFKGIAQQVTLTLQQQHTHNMTKSSNNTKSMTPPTIVPNRRNALYLHEEVLQTQSTGQEIPPLGPEDEPR